jgi:hypothetical protein
LAPTIDVCATSPVAAKQTASTTLRTIVEVIVMILLVLTISRIQNRKRLYQSSGSLFSRLRGHLSQGTMKFFP